MLGMRSTRNCLAGCCKGPAKLTDKKVVYYSLHYRNSVEALVGYTGLKVYCEYEVSCGTRSGGDAERSWSRDAGTVRDSCAAEVPRESSGKSVYCNWMGPLFVT
jgi:hypothetical protein